MEGDKNVGHPSYLPVLPPSVFTSSPAAQTLPHMWPFGGSNWNNTQHPNAASKSKKFRTHTTNAPADDVEQNSSDDDSDDDAFGGSRGRRRLSVTTEAKRRTSLEDDDDEDEEVVHVKLAEVDVQQGGFVEEREEGELVEVMHAEIKEGAGK